MPDHGPVCLEVRGRPCGHMRQPAALAMVRQLGTALCDNFEAPSVYCIQNAYGSTFEMMVDRTFQALTCDYSRWGFGQSFRLVPFRSTKVCTRSSVMLKL